MSYNDNRGHSRVQLKSGSSLICADDNVYFYEEIADIESIMTTRKKQAALSHSLHTFPFFPVSLAPCTQRELTALSFCTEATIIFLDMAITF